MQHPIRRTSRSRLLAKVASVASFIPGPIGQIAAGVETAAHLATGNYKAAAAAAVGLIPGGKYLATAAKFAFKAGKAAAKSGVKAAKRVFRSRPCGNSFTEGTPVILADGSSKPIEDVVIGDEVLSSDTVDQSTQPVIGLIRYKKDHVWIELKITGDDGQTETVTATDHHPFWAISGNGTWAWTDAGDLAAGDRLVTTTGTLAKVTATATRSATDWAYNFTVANTHTYYVGHDAIAALSHNASCDVSMTAHGLGRARGSRGDKRYIPMMAIRDTIHNPVTLMPGTGKHLGTTSYFSRDLQVATNRSGKVITVIPQSQKGLR